MTLTFLISQVLAGIALIFSLMSFQFKDRKWILLCLLIGALCIALQYFFLERYVGAALVGVGFTRYLVSYYYPRSFFIPIFISIFGILTYILWRDIYDILPFLSASTNTIGAFQKNDKYLRIFMFFGAPILILYYFLIGSPVGMLLESIFLGSNLIGYYRYYIKKRVD